MENPSDFKRKDYIKNFYAQYWITARGNKYGFSVYDKSLTELIMTCQIPEAAPILDVGIGTGFPFGEFFMKSGYEVHGIDLSQVLVEKCRVDYPTIDARVGDVEAIEFPDGTFKCAYCFHSTWYFSDLNRAIGEMLRVTQDGGVVAFDFLNLQNEKVANEHRRKMHEQAHFFSPYRWLRYFKNIVKMIIRRGTVEWSSMVYIFPALPGDIVQNLYSNWMLTPVWYGRTQSDALELVTDQEKLSQYARLVCIIRK